MKPKIGHTAFGSITIGENDYEFDIVITLDGDVKKRKKKLSKKVSGTSHKVSLDEIKDIFQKGTERLIIGAGQYGMLSLTEAARDYLKRKECAVSLTPTPEAIKVWNEAHGKIIGLFHITC